jgi:hypothetical protein
MWWLGGDLVFIRVRNFLGSVAYAAVRVQGVLADEDES